MDEIIFKKIEERKKLFDNEEYDVVLYHYPVIKKIYLLGMLGMIEEWEKS